MIRLLLVDDSLLMRTVLHRHALHDERLIVVGEASTGRDAIDIAAREQPDAVVLDHEMPTMSGSQAIPYLLHVAPHAVIVLLSSHIEVGETEHHTVGPDAHAYFSKSAPIPEILDAVVELVENARRGAT